MMEAIKVLNDDALELAAGGRPIGRDGKPCSPSEYKRLFEEDRIHTTSATF